MWVLSCATSAYPAHILYSRTSRASVSIRSCARTSVTVRSHHPFVPEVSEAVDSLHSEFRAVDNLVACNTARVLKAFQSVGVGSHHFGGSTGYGHDEAGGREALDGAFAQIVGAESAIVRAQFFSGTHAITCALFAFLRPGDELLAVAGAPYDTLEEVIGIRDSHGLGSLKEFGVSYREVPLAEDGGLDWDALAVALKPQTKCALIQRSCGYSWRRSLSVNEIGRAIKMIKAQNPNCLVMVDNCYGEFAESMEPPMVGADLIAGSLIKNPGGTIAPCGGYVAGKKKWVKAAAARLSAPGLGIDCGSIPGDIMRTFFQGLFLAPQMVGEAIKGSFLIAEVMASKGYKVQPLPRVPRHDTVQLQHLKIKPYQQAVLLKGLCLVVIIDQLSRMIDEGDEGVAVEKKVFSLGNWDKGMAKIKEKKLNDKVYWVILPVGILSNLGEWMRVQATLFWARGFSSNDGGILATAQIDRNLRGAFIAITARQGRGARTICIQKDQRLGLPFMGYLPGMFDLYAPA